MTPLDIFLRLLAGLVVGFCVGMTGVGGGVLGIPMLTIGLGLENTVAVGTGSAYLFLSNIFAAYEHRRHNNLWLPVARVLLIGAVPATIITSLSIGQRYKALKASTELADKALLVSVDRWVGIAMGLVMLTAVISLIVVFVRDLRRDRAAARVAAASPEPAEPASTERVLPKPLTPKTRALGVFLGAIFGVVIGATSMGNALVVPMMIIIFGMSASLTVGTTVLIAVVVNLFNAGGYLLSGNVDLPTVGLMFVGSLIGVKSGSRLTNVVPDRWLKGTMITVIAIATIMMFAKVCRTTAPAPAKAVSPAPLAAPAVPDSPTTP